MLKENDTQDIKTKLQELEDKYKGWNMGFSHFVEMEIEPTGQCLWFMLSRRAAGFSREAVKKKESMFSFRSLMIQQRTRRCLSFWFKSRVMS